MLKKVALYIRISKEDEFLLEKAESESVLNQKNMLREYVENNTSLNNYNIIEYIDDGYSGISTDRIALKELLNDARKGDINCIVVKDLSRLSRNYIDAGNFLEQVFPFLGVRFISINDNYDSENFIGKTTGFEVSFKNLIYDLYSKDLSEKIKLGQESKMRKGYYLGAFPPFGYKKSNDNKYKLKVSENEASVVKLIFDLRYYENKSLYDIARELNTLEIQTPSMFFKEKRMKNNKFQQVSEKPIWNYHMIRPILLRREYIGAVVGKKRIITKIGTYESRKSKCDEKIIVEDVHEPIISKKIFESVNEKFNKGNRKSPHKIIRPLYGKVRCGYCKHIMNRSHTKKIYYICNYSREDLDSKHSKNKFYEDDIETVVLKSINKQIVMIRNLGLNIDNMERKLDNNKLRLNKLNCDIKTIKNKKTLIYEEYRMKRINKEKFFIEKDKEIKKERRLKNEIKKIESGDEVLEKNSLKVYKLLKESNIIDILDENIVNIFVKDIYLYSNNRIEISWKFGDVII